MFRRQAEGRFIGDDPGDASSQKWMVVDHQDRDGLETRIFNTPPPLHFADVAKGVEVAKR